MSESIIKLFYAALDDVQTQAESRGMTMTSICRDLGIARATPDRWRKNPPNTIKLLEQMQRIASGASTNTKGPAFRAVPDLPTDFFKRGE